MFGFINKLWTPIDYTEKSDKNGCDCGKQDCTCFTRKTFFLGLGALALAGSVARIAVPSPLTGIVDGASWGPITQFPKGVQSILSVNYLERQFQASYGTPQIYRRFGELK
jgi:hypothetical protein